MFFFGPVGQKYFKNFMKLTYFITTYLISLVVFF